MLDVHNVQVFSIIGILFGLYWFTSSFFLAKQSLPLTSGCDEVYDLLHNVLHLQKHEIQQLSDIVNIADTGTDDNDDNSSHRTRRRNGCWMDRQVDSIILLLVDALRFDFAYYEMPKSIGRRLSTSASSNNSSSSKLYQFLADPPTVTMQRIKAITTGTLPTFADISANFGGGTLDNEDNWIQQLVRRNRGLSSSQQTTTTKTVETAFVGDDTWLDLFPNNTNTFTYAYPYPSFNTRDLDTVDNGCWEHLPDIVANMRMRGGNYSTSSKSSSSSNNNNGGQIEVAIVHFLGVDHVGHTYGPHNKYMDEKLRTIDNGLSVVLDALDDDSGTSSSCHMAMIFGDHGMTEDGNHGGGTNDETHAALFVHTSPGCGGGSTMQSNNIPKTEGLETMSEFVQEHLIFPAIHQIDIVPTISFLLGLPIPYANLGSLVPSILLQLFGGLGNNNNHDDDGSKSESAVQLLTAALALNAAQVWRYYTVYSQTAKQLPGLSDLKYKLDIAVQTYQQALLLSSSSRRRNNDKDNNNNNNNGEEDNQHNDEDDDDEYLQASTMFKTFLVEALELGQRVWTRFDTKGMIGGIFIQILSMLLLARPFFCSKLLFPPPLSSSTRMVQQCSWSISWDVWTAGFFMLYLCGILTFSNSYILEEEDSIMYGLSVLCLVLALQHSNDPGDHQSRTTTHHDQRNHRRSPAFSKFSWWRWLGGGVDENGNGNTGMVVRLLFLLPVTCRFHELFASGHGLDPSIRLHAAHSAMVFLPSLLLLMAMRWLLWNYYQRTIASSSSRWHAILDVVALMCIAVSWWEKRTPDPDRNGYGFCQIALVLLFGGIPWSMLQPILGQRRNIPHLTENPSSQGSNDGLNDDTIGCDILTVVSKVLIFIMTVTGPATAISLVLYSTQAGIVFYLATISSHHQPMPSMVIAALWRMVTRHVFFATNHGCGFNRLQYSAAFVATQEFYFVTGGISLFLNTFGWEMVGILVAFLLSRQKHHAHLFRIYSLYQALEMVTSCISVSLLRRHLMVWDIYAPHFLFVAIYTVLHMLSQLTVVLLSATATTATTAPPSSSLKRTT